MSPILLAAAYSTHGVGLFNGISESGTIIPTGVGFGLILTGASIRLLQEQGKAATGQRPDFGGLLYEVLACITFLALHGVIAHNVWAAAQEISTSIYPDTKMAALIKSLSAVAGRFKDYSFSVIGLGAALKDSAVVVVALFAWVLTLLAHWQLEVLQVCVYNVIFAFAPILIGLSMFGFGGRKLWFSAVIEVSSWSITMAVVYRSIDDALYGYLKEASGLSVSDSKFLDVISMLAFMTSLPFVVPIVTGRLIGSQALGALGSLSMGSTMVDKAFSAGRSFMSDVGGAVKPGSNDVSSQTGPAVKRPGDS